MNVSSMNDADRQSAKASAERLNDGDPRRAESCGRPGMAPREMPSVPFTGQRHLDSDGHKNKTQGTGNCKLINALISTLSVGCKHHAYHLSRLFFEQVLARKGISTSGQAHQVNYLLLTSALGLVM